MTPPSRGELVQARAASHERDVVPREPRGAPAKAGAHRACAEDANLSC